MKDVIIVVIVLAIVGFAITYIKKEAKKGVRCVGCPASSGCSKCHCHS